MNRNDNDSRKNCCLWVLCAINAPAIALLMAPAIGLALYALYWTIEEE